MKITKLLVIVAGLLSPKVFASKPMPVEGYRELSPKEGEAYRDALWLVVEPTVQTSAQCKSETLEQIFHSRATTLWVQDNQKQPLFLFDLEVYPKTYDRLLITTADDYHLVTSIVGQTLQEKQVNHGDLLHPDLHNEFVQIGEVNCLPVATPQKEIL